MSSKALVIAAVLSFVALPAFAQDRDTDHHYQGGPKTEVPHHVGKRTTGSASTTGQAGQHHYQGGPKTEVPHHVGDKATAKKPKSGA